MPRTTPSRMRRFFSRVLARRDLAEAQRIEDRDGARAHSENIAQDAADASGRSLERLNVTRMIVGFDFEGRDKAVADVHDTGVFTRALHDKLAACGQALQVNFARFVGAMFAPHHAEDAQFGDVRVAAKDLLNARVFLGRNAVFGGNHGSDSNFSASGGHVQIWKNRRQLMLSPSRRRQALRSWSGK
jgi:hypothetical protein